MSKILIISILAVSIGYSAELPKPLNVPSEAVTPPEQKVSPSPAVSTADDKQIVDEIKRIVGKILGLDPKTIDVNAPLSKQKVAADELDVIEIVMAVEETFNVEIKDEELEGADLSQMTNITISKLAEIVARKQKGKPAERQAASANSRG